jgi:hypothetical protein
MAVSKIDAPDYNSVSIRGDGPSAVVTGPGSTFENQTVTNGPVPIVKAMFSNLNKRAKILARAVDSTTSQNINIKTVKQHCSSPHPVQHVHEKRVVNCRISG